MIVRRSLRTLFYLLIMKLLHNMNCFYFYVLAINALERSEYCSLRTATLSQERSPPLMD